MADDILRPITNLLNNDYVLAVFLIVAFSYASLSAPKLPNWIYRFFSNDLMKVLFLSLLLFVRFDTRPTVALIISFIFVYMFQLVEMRKQMEYFTQSTHSVIKSYSNMNEENTILDLNPLTYPTISLP